MYILFYWNIKFALILVNCHDLISVSHFIISFSIFVSLFSTFIFSSVNVFFICLQPRRFKNLLFVYHNIILDSQAILMKLIYWYAELIFQFKSILVLYKSTLKYYYTRVQKKRYTYIFKFKIHAFLFYYLSIPLPCHVFIPFLSNWTLFFLWTIESSILGIPYGCFDHFWSYLTNWVSQFPSVKLTCNLLYRSISAQNSDSLIFYHFLIVVVSGNLQLWQIFWWQMVHIVIQFTILKCIKSNTYAIGYLWPFIVI